MRKVVLFTVLGVLALVAVVTNMEGPTVLLHQGECATMKNLLSTQQAQFCVGEPYQKALGIWWIHLRKLQGGEEEEVDNPLVPRFGCSLYQSSLAGCEEWMILRNRWALHGKLVSGQAMLVFNLLWSRVD